MKILEMISYVLVLAAVALWMWVPLWCPWLMGVGAAGLLATHLNERYSGNDLRQRRNMRLRHLLPLCYCVAAYYMYCHTMEWLAPVCVAVALELYTLFVISKREK